MKQQSIDLLSMSLFTDSSLEQETNKNAKKMKPILIRQ